MTTSEILDRLTDLGVSVRIVGDKVRVTPVSKVPSDLMEEAKAHKAEIVQELHVVYGDGQSPPLDRPPVNEQELRRLIDHLADPEAFSEWMEWAMNYQDDNEAGLI